MHWHIPTQLEDATEGGTLWVNACLAATGKHIEDGERATCKKCRLLFEHPNTVSIAAAKLRHAVIAIQEEGKYWAEVRCNACVHDVDVTELTYEQAHAGVIRLAVFLRHVAYDHMGGSHVNLVRVEDFASAYQNNYAVGKPAGTQHEVAWRKRQNLSPVFPVFGDIGRLSADARIVESP